MKIAVHNIVKSYNSDFSLNVKSLQIEESQKIILTGNNGSGKSTLLQLILGLVKGSSGEVLIDGLEITQHNTWKSRMAAYLDESFLFDFLTPMEYFHFLLKFKNKKPDVDHLIASLNLGNFLKDLPKTKKLIRDLSSGNKQKVGLAGALLTVPEILILDEPYNYLDIESCEQLTGVLNSEPFKKSVVILSIHSKELVFSGPKRLIAMENGSVYSDNIIS